MIKNDPNLRDNYKGNNDEDDARLENEHENSIQHKQDIHDRSNGSFHDEMENIGNASLYDDCIPVQVPDTGCELG